MSYNSWPNFNFAMIFNFCCQIKINFIQFGIIVYKFGDKTFALVDKMKSKFNFFSKMPVFNWTISDNFFQSFSKIVHGPKDEESELPLWNYQNVVSKKYQYNPGLKLPYWFMYSNFCLEKKAELKQFFIN